DAIVIRPLGRLDVVSRGRRALGLRELLEAGFVVGLAGHPEVQAGLEEATGEVEGARRARVDAHRAHDGLERRGEEAGLGAAARADLALAEAERGAEPELFGEPREPPFADQVRPAT